MPQAHPQTLDPGPRLECCALTRIVDCGTSDAAGLLVQVQEDCPGNLAAWYRHISKGAWPFSSRDHGWPIADCSAEGLKVRTAGGGPGGGGPPWHASARPVGQPSTGRGCALSLYRLTRSQAALLRCPACAGQARHPLIMLSCAWVSGTLPHGPSTAPFWVFLSTQLRPRACRWLTRAACMHAGGPDPAPAGSQGGHPRRAPVRLRQRHPVPAQPGRRLGHL